MAGVRTPDRQFSSCVLIEAGDSLDSIFTTAHAIGRYVSQKAGIGIGAGALRAVGSSIRNGSATHTGLIPFYRLWQSAIKSCSQGGVRGGAGTAYFPIWHLEIEDLLVLKNNKGTEVNRLRQLDYGVQFSKLFYERFISGGNITLFSPNDVPGLYDAFFADQNKFKELYEAAENNENIRKKVISAMELFSIFVGERAETGRIYLMNVDHANEHGSFKPEIAPIRQSNLCAEITLPTKPLENIDDENGEISLCTLSAINWGLINNPAEFEKYCDLAVRGLDELLDIQDYPIKAARISTMNRRPLGIGIINFAYFLAKNDLTYDEISEDGLQFIDRYAQYWSYYTTKASIELAKEKGACPLSWQTKYSDGILPVDTYKKAVNDLIPHNDVVDWESLREDLKQHGIRNSTLLALMPCETSAQLGNCTNGIEPPRGLISVKKSKDGSLKQVVPEIKKLKNKYNLLWDQKSPIGYLKIAAVLNKYLDQTGSWNTSWNPTHYENEQIPLSEMITVILTVYKWGLKTLYYNNTNDMAGEIEDSTTPIALSEEVVEDGDTECSACIL
jgi:ribonucleoside-diphosphate reductase alpha chain